MIDIAATSAGDISIVDGDIALTGTSPEEAREQAVEIAQRVYFALKTEMGDFLLHTDIGHRLNELMGRPNNKETGEYGKTLIMRALSSVGISKGVSIDAWPDETRNKINFEIKITFGVKPNVVTFVISSLITR